MKGKSKNNIFFSLVCGKEANQFLHGVNSVTIVNFKAENRPRFNGAILFCSVPDNDMQYDGVTLESGIPIVLDFDKPEQVVMFDFVARAQELKVRWIL